MIITQPLEITTPDGRGTGRWRLVEMSDEHDGAEPLCNCGGLASDNPTTCGHESPEAARECPIAAAKVAHLQPARPTVAAATPLEHAIAKGREILAEQRVYIESVKARAGLAVIAGHIVPVVNCGRHCASEIVGELAEGYPFAASWEERDGMFHYELRSRAPCAIPVNDVAREFGGGGHKMAAGFAVPRVVHTSAEGATEVTP